MNVTVYVAYDEFFVRTLLDSPVNGNEKSIEIDESLLETFRALEHHYFEVQAEIKKLVANQHPQGGIDGSPQLVSS